jgi:sec-independent protein translocase protein TatA
MQESLMPTFAFVCPSCLPDAVLAIGLPSGGEWIILLVLGLLIFGRRLPEVGRSLGRGIIEFKKGIKGIDDEIVEESSRPSARATERSRQELPDAGETVQRSEERKSYATAEPRPREE